MFLKRKKGSHPFAELYNAQLVLSSACCSYNSGRQNLSHIQPLAHSTATHICEHLVDQFACDRSWHTISAGCTALQTPVFCGIFYLFPHKLLSAMGELGTEQHWCWQQQETAFWITLYGASFAAI